MKFKIFEERIEIIERTLERDFHVIFINTMMKSKDNIESKPL